LQDRAARADNAGVVVVVVVLLLIQAPVEQAELVVAVVRLSIVGKQLK
jgi:hypothetical protein